jgi:hypothetical protein
MGGSGAASGGSSPSSSSAAGAAAVRDPRLSAKVNSLDSNPDFGWGKIMGYATAEDCVRVYAQLCVAFGPGARVKRSVWFLRKKMVMAYLTQAERACVFSLVSVAFGRGAAALKRSAKFGKPIYDPAGAALVLADGSIALDRLEAASIRFPALEDVSVRLIGDLSDSKGFTDASRAPILAKLCTFTFVTTLVLHRNDIAVVPDAIGALTNLKKLSLFNNDIAVVPDAIGALTNLKELDLRGSRGGNKIATLPASIGRLTALEKLYLDDNILTAVPASIGSLTALTTLSLTSNRIATLPTTIGGMTALTDLNLNSNQLAGLPDAIGQLTGLKSLWLNSNQLTALPESIVALCNLASLRLTKNPQLIRSAQSAAVQAWLQALEDTPWSYLDMTLWEKCPPPPVSWLVRRWRDTSLRSWWMDGTLLWELLKRLMAFMLIFMLWVVAIMSLCERSVRFCPLSF